MFAFRMKSSNKLVHSLIHSSIGKEHEHPCDCVSEPNHRHCNVMRLVRCVMCVCNGITMYSHTMMGIVCFAPHVFLFFIFVYLSCARSLVRSLSPCSHCVTHRHKLYPEFQSQWNVPLKPKRNRSKTHKIQFNLFSISH